MASAHQEPRLLTTKEPTQSKKLISENMCPTSSERGSVRCFPLTKHWRRKLCTTVGSPIDCFLRSTGTFEWALRWHGLALKSQKNNMNPPTSLSPNIWMKHRDETGKLTTWMYSSITFKELCCLTFPAAWWRFVSLNCLAPLRRCAARALRSVFERSCAAALLRRCAATPVRCAKVLFLSLMRRYAAAPLYADTPLRRYTPIRRCADTPLRRCAAAPLRRCADTPLRHCAAVQDALLRRYAATPLRRWWHTCTFVTPALILNSYNLK